MPNWCDCTYKCVGDLKEVKSLYKILKYIDRRKTSIEKNGFGKWGYPLSSGTHCLQKGDAAHVPLELSDLRLSGLIIIFSLSVNPQLGVSRKEYEILSKKNSHPLKYIFKRKNRDVVYIPRMMQVANISRNVTTWIRAMMIRSILQLSKKRLNVFLR